MDQECLEQMGISEEVAALALGLPTGNAALQLIAALLNQQLTNSQAAKVFLGEEWLAANDNATDAILASIPEGAIGMIITAYRNDIYFTLIAGASPSTGHAHLLQKDQSLDLNVSAAALAAFRFCAIDAASTADLYVTYYK